MIRTRQLFLWVCLLLPALAGCLPAAPSTAPMVARRPAGCTSFLAALQNEIDAAGVGNAASYQIPGFPYLRADRFLAIRPEIKPFSAENAAAWIDELRGLDGRARQSEIRNLPSAARQRISSGYQLASDPASLQLYVESCAGELWQSDRQSADFVSAVRSAAQVPDEYRLAYRVAGLYPLTSLPVLYLTDKARRTFLEWHKTDPQQLPVAGHLRAFTPTRDAEGGMSVVDLYSSAARDWLGLPLLTAEQELRLVGLLAPVLVQDVVDADDVPGLVAWEDGHVRIDSGQPSGYYFFSRALYRRQPVLQVNYVFWYGARKGPEAPWIEQGNLDGLTVRVTLAPDGKPFMVDVMNNCGCYHFFVPSSTAVAKVRDLPWSLDAFVPTWLPYDYPRRRLLLRVNAGWHQVQHVSSGMPFSDVTGYQLHPYAELESLPGGAGDRVSLFDPRGVAKGSPRNEYLLLFPMGLPDVGSMRQRGHQAIRLVGREHFDDPLLFDHNFVWSADETEVEEPELEFLPGD